MRKTLSRILKWIGQLFGLYRNTDESNNDCHAYEPAKPLIDSNGELTSEGRKRSNSFRSGSNNDSYNPMIEPITNTKDGKTIELDRVSTNGVGY